MPPTNYSFGAGRINLRPASAGVSPVARPSFSGATQDRISGVSRTTPNTSRPAFSPDALDDDTQQVSAGLRGVNNFGDSITAMKQLGAQRRQKAQQQEQQSAGVVGTTGRQQEADFTQYNGPATGARAQLVNSALSLQGEKYAWGGGGPGRRVSHGVPGGPGSNVVGVDCSGLTSYAYSQIGIKIPHLARAQGTIGYRTSVKNLQPGDLVVWNNGSHTSMYMGNGRIVESVPSTGPRVRMLRPGEAVTGVHIKLPGE